MQGTNDSYKHTAITDTVPVLTERVHLKHYIASSIGRSSSDSINVSCSSTHNISCLKSKAHKQELYMTNVDDTIKYVADVSLSVYSAVHIHIVVYGQVKFKQLA
eukprot:15600-Heterococcus_DN1.PRE.3